MSNCDTHTLVLGVGNILLQDEGAGVHAVNALKNIPLPSYVTLADGGTLGMQLIHTIAQYSRLIVIDASLDGFAPGTVRIIRPHSHADFPEHLTAHEIGLSDVIETLSLTGTLIDIVLITITAEKYTHLSMSLSDPVKAAIPRVVRIVQQIV